MKSIKWFTLLLVVAMVFSISIFAAATDGEILSSDLKKNDPTELTLKGNNAYALSLEDGKLLSFDKDGVETTTYLTKEEVEVKLAEIRINSYDTGNINQFVPKNIDGYQGVPVGGAFNIVSPHIYVNLHIISLPQTTMPTINVSFTNEIGDDTGWVANVPQGYLVWMQPFYPNERYAAKVSTNELYASTGFMRSFTD